VQDDRALDLWHEAARTPYGFAMREEVERLRHINGDLSRERRALKAEIETLKARIAELEQVERLAEETSR
jgi:predicted nuclease with TOPRIM domain